MTARLRATGTTAKEPDTVRAPGAVPLAGHTLRLLRDPLGFLLAQHGGAESVELRLGLRPVYLLTRAETVRRVLVTDQRHYDKGGPIIEGARPLFGDGLGTCPRSEHRRQRSLLQPAFHSARIAAYSPVMQACAEEVAGSWQDGRTLDLGREMYRIAARVIGRTLASDPAASRLVQDIEEALPTLMGHGFLRVVVPWSLPHELPLAANRRYQEARSVVRASIDDTIAAYRRSGTTRTDLLGHLVTVRDEHGAGLDDREIHDQIMVMLIAGIETTATALGWTFHLLGRSPEAERRVTAEIDAVLCGRSPTVEDLSRLPYLTRVFTEALRLYPTVPLLSRVATTEVTLGGRTLPAGTEFFLSPYCLHRDPEVFPEPERFDPDRWLPERVGPEQRRGFLPWGAGARKCIGDTFSLTEASLALATILRDWRLRPDPASRVTPTVRFSLHPSGLRMTAHRRSSPHPARGAGNCATGHDAPAAARQAQDAPR
ncbi:cytochrome P450 [Streptomyces sp. UNOC14_S4]|uniref:cytochrome P450 n=1 Tax=Streptomyces sp. UNOC14_S4 TaxID=2872340 RepID=UPI001E33DC77|nr:cytochrome P450 [Streptomyces sp. UNOC14_S4]MCC3768469.1 cytochrome P450 [Streptomyces sp. UNOC14_S4]